MRLSALIALFLLNFTVKAQIYNLTGLASGQMQMFVPIYEEDKNIYGYFSLYKLDKLDENTEKYEYVILDRNLNNVANGEFMDTAYKGVMSQYYSPDKIRNQLLITKLYSNLNGSITFTSTRLLNLETNEILEPFYIEEGLLQQGFRPIDNLKKEQKKREYVNLPIGTNEGFVVVRIEKNATKKPSSLVSFYSSSYQKLWDYDFENIQDTGEYDLLSYENDVLYFSYKERAFRDAKVEFRQLNAKTGKLNFTYLLEQADSQYSHGFTVKKIGDRTILTGNISPYRPEGYNYQHNMGLFKIVLDENGKELFKKYFLWEDANEFIEMNKYGKLEAGYKLFVHDYFVFKDERVIALSEKYKIGTNLLVGGIVKTTDFVLLEFDKDFNLTFATTINKDLSKFSVSDYLFSQYLNDEKDGVFFYRDYKKDDETKEKNWILGIVSFIDGEMHHENIPISSDEHFIVPYVAKEGYILMREFNKNSDFDEIRLERLNLD